MSIPGFHTVALTSLSLRSSAVMTSLSCQNTVPPSPAFRPFSVMSIPGCHPGMAASSQGDDGRYARPTVLPMACVLTTLFTLRTTVNACGLTTRNMS